MLGTYLNHRIHTNAARRLRRRAQSHECTLVQGEGGHRRRSCRSLRAPCGLCLGEPSCTPSRPPPQESPNNIGNKSYYSDSNMGSSSSIAPMPSALRPIVTLQQLRFSFSFFHLHSPEGRPCMQHSTNTNSARCIAGLRFGEGASRISCAPCGSCLASIDTEITFGTAMSQETVNWCS